MNRKTILKYLRGLIFLFLFLALIGTFFNHQEQFKTGILSRLYGHEAANWVGLVFLLSGWAFCEFAFGKRKSNLLSTIAIAQLIIAATLIAHFLAFIGIFMAIIAMIPFMVFEFNNNGFKTIVFRKK